MFASIDVNHDGQINKAEMLEFIQNVRATEVADVQEAIAEAVHEEEKKELIDEIWDQFDQTGTHEHKTQLITDLMKRDDIEHLYQQNLPMVQHNVELYNSGAFLKKFAQMAVDKLENLLP
jgi:hypothetical protein